MTRFFLFVFSCVAFFAADIRAEDGLSQKIRYPIAARTYYPQNGRELLKKANDLIDRAESRLRLSLTPIPKAIIVPHGPLYFSGETAAAAFDTLRRLKPFVRRVVLIGSSHQGKYFGISLSEAKYWKIPGRNFETDRELTEKLLKIQGVGFDNAAHEAEYSLETQLPFVAAVFRPDVKILPVLVEDASVEQVADLIDAVWGGPETVVVITTDMAEGKNAATVRKQIVQTAAAIEKQDSSRLSEKELCAPLPVAGLLAYARENGLEIKQLELKTSADSFEKISPVTGYGAFAVYETNKTLEDSRSETDAFLRQNQEALLRIAAQSVLSGFERGRALRVKESRYSDDLQQKGATFVNIYYNGALRGSAGSTDPVRSILDDVAENAYAAAFSDFRFLPLDEKQIRQSEITISLLTRPVPVKFKDEKDLLSKMRAGIDGLILRERSNKALFLPQIWETFSTPEDFLSHLKQKAGLSADYWSPTLKVYRFEVVDINSGDLENPKSIWQSK